MSNLTELKELVEEEVKSNYSGMFEPDRDEVEERVYAEIEYRIDALDYGDIVDCLSRNTALILHTEVESTDTPYNALVQAIAVCLEEMTSDIVDSIMDYFE